MTRITPAEAVTRILALHAQQETPIASFLDSRPADLSDLASVMGVPLDVVLEARRLIDEGRIAQYGDASGDYTILVDGDQMTTAIWTGNDVEIIVNTITRATEFDAIDLFDWAITDTFASSPDFGTDGVVWIKGLAYDVSAPRTIVSL